MKLGDLIGCLARWLSKECNQIIRKHAIRPLEIKVFRIQPELAIVSQRYELPHVLTEAIGSIRREPHHLVLTAEHLETQVIGNGAIEEADGVWETNLVTNLNLAAGSDRE